MVRISIPEDIVFDGDLAEPKSGEMLSGLGIRIVPGPNDQPPESVTVTGVVSWVRVDGDLVECVVDCKTLRVVTESSLAGEPVPELGAERTMSGRLYGIRNYLYTDFDLPLPDAPQSWMVQYVELRDHFFVVDAEPIQFGHG
ncbi:MAG: hypothetical protein JWR36_136 [Glaciihabitans sp.]|nr:hypothetical protein [Glaciihabitans sp.]